MPIAKIEVRRPRPAHEVAALIEAGRSLNAKRALYESVVRRFGELGIAASDIIIVLHEPPLENWGIRGGKPGSEVDLGFDLNA